MSGRPDGPWPPVDEFGPESLARAIEALAAGSVVGVPTDTVYGLAARVDRLGALTAIFSLKGRPPGLALPVLVASVDQVEEVAPPLNGYAALLAERFWPGPLTVVVACLAPVGPLLGGDGVSVGIRLPDHDGMRALCREAGPLAVTSANRHGGRPRTTADGVARVFAGQPEVALVLDGGTCDGTPSTVVDCTGPGPRCLRQGALPFELVAAAGA